MENVSPELCPVNSNRPRIVLTAPCSFIRVVTPVVRFSRCHRFGCLHRSFNRARLFRVRSSQCFSRSSLFLLPLVSSAVGSCAWPSDVFVRRLARRGGK